MGLLRPSNETVIQEVDRMALHRLFAALVSKDVQTICKVDCRSLIVKMRTEVSQTPAIPWNGFPQDTSKTLLPLPKMLVEVNITLPDLSKLNEVSVPHLATNGNKIG
jgi:hypothetical protein